MKTVGVRLPSDVILEIDKRAESLGITRSEMVFRLLTEALGMPPPQKHLEITDVSSQLAALTKRVTALEQRITPARIESTSKVFVPEVSTQPKLPDEALEGISQRELARRLGCSHPHVAKMRSRGKLGELGWRYENGKYYPVGE